MELRDCTHKKTLYLLNSTFPQVEGKTNNRIKDLLSGDSLDESTRLVLVNALYFKVNLNLKPITILFT